MKNKRDLILSGILLIVLFALSWFANSELDSYIRRIVNLCLIYAIIGLSMNVTNGFAGQFSLGQAGFMAIGAYTVGIFTVPVELRANVFYAVPMNPFIADIQMPVWLALIVGGLLAALVAFLIGTPVLRLRGDYLAIVTLAFGEIVKNFINVVYLGIDNNGLHFSIKDALSLNMGEGSKVIINGAQGITGTPKNSTFTIGIVIILITLFIVLNLINSRSGRAIMAIRDNRIAAESIGINITKYKLMAFTISASIAGVGGALYAHNLSTLTALPKNFGYNMSIMILVFVVLGGIGNMRGSIIAAVLLTLLPEMLRGLNDYRMLIYAIVLIAMMLFNWSPKAREFRDKYSFKRLFTKKSEKKKEA